MRALIQRVSSGKVTVEDQTIAQIGQRAGHPAGHRSRRWGRTGRYLAEKIANLRIFEDAGGKTNLSVLDVGGEAIVVSQFTLYADTRKGRRPSFIYAADPDVAAPLVERFAELLRGHGVPTQTGQFGAHMQVEINNDGPVTIWLEK